MTPEVAAAGVVLASRQGVRVRKAGRMKPWTVADIPDQTGRVAVVTGANSGIGLVAARELAEAGAYVVMACRNLDKANEARSTVPGGDDHSEVRHLDLADLDSVRAFADGVSGWRIDVLINNAGVMAIPEQRTAQGHEMQFGVNVLGHFLLTSLLLPKLTDRVVWLSSLAHRWDGLDLDDLDWRRHPYSRWKAYGASKLGDLLLAYELQRRLLRVGSGLRSMAAHPGTAATALFSHTGIIPFGRVAERLVPVLGQSADAGALPELYAATIPDLPGGSYIGPHAAREWRGHPRPVGSSMSSHDRDLAAALWARCEEMSGSGPWPR